MSDVDVAVVGSGADKYRRKGPLGFFHYVPGFLYIFLVYVIAHFIVKNPRAELFSLGNYKLSWVEVLLVAAAIIAMSEQIKVAKPGINNTLEVMYMGAIAIAQLVLFALAAAKVRGLSLFDNTEFLLLTLINMAQTAVAYWINSATLMRTISSS